MSKALGASLILALLLGGCAVGVKHDYNQKALDLSAVAGASVAVGTLDKRPYVVDGQKPPNFVGLSRGGFGNPFDVTTRSGKPLASDISGSIVESMKGKSANAKLVELSPSLSVDGARTALLAAGMQKSVLITLVEWKADTMMNVRLTYDFELRVFDRDGKLLMSTKQAGDENIGGSAFNPPAASRTEVPARFRRMMEALFKEPDVAKALRP